MARMGSLASSGLKCGKCGTSVTPGELVCPSCGAHFATALCGRCGYRGPRENFRYYRCPACGHRSDIGKKVFGPLLALAALIVILYLAFALGR